MWQICVLATIFTWNRELNSHLRDLSQAKFFVIFVGYELYCECCLRNSCGQSHAQWDTGFWCPFKHNLVNRLSVKGLKPVNRDVIFCCFVQQASTDKQYEMTLYTGPPPLFFQSERLPSFHAVPFVLLHFWPWCQKLCPRWKKVQIFASNVQPFSCILCGSLHKTDKTRRD